MEPMPTRSGDVVIVVEESPGLLAVWTVSHAGQQAPEPETHTCSALGLEPAKKLARLMARETTGSAFVFERGSSTWTKLSR